MNAQLLDRCRSPGIIVWPTWTRDAVIDFIFGEQAQDGTIQDQSEHMSDDKVCPPLTMFNKIIKALSNHVPTAARNAGEARGPAAPAGTAQTRSSATNPAAGVKATIARRRKENFLQRLANQPAAAPPDAHRRDVQFTRTEAAAGLPAHTRQEKSRAELDEITTARLVQSTAAAKRQNDLAKADRKEWNAQDTERSKMSPADQEASLNNEIKVLLKRQLEPFISDGAAARLRHRMQSLKNAKQTLPSRAQDLKLQELNARLAKLPTATQIADQQMQSLAARLERLKGG